MIMFWVQLFAGLIVVWGAIFVYLLVIVSYTALKAKINDIVNYLLT